MCGCPPQTAQWEEFNTAAALAAYKRASGWHGIDSVRSLMTTRWDIAQRGVDAVATMIAGAVKLQRLYGALRVCATGVGGAQSNSRARAIANTRVPRAA